MEHRQNKVNLIISDLQQENPKIKNNINQFEFWGEIFFKNMSKIHGKLRNKSPKLKMRDAESSCASLLLPENQRVLEVLAFWWF
jgi:hypothetical protein